MRYFIFQKVVKWCKYKEIAYMPVKYPPTAEILEDLHQLQKEITAGLTELEQML